MWRTPPRDTKLNGGDSLGNILEWWQFLGIGRLEACFSTHLALMVPTSRGGFQREKDSGAQRIPKHFFFEFHRCQGVGRCAQNLKGSTQLVFPLFPMGTCPMVPFGCEV